MRLLYTACRLARSRTKRLRLLARPFSAERLLFQLCPTILGGGRKTFPDTVGFANLERVAVRTYDTGVVFLHYEPRR